MDITEVRRARQARDQVLQDPTTTVVQRAQAREDFFAFITRAYFTRTLTIQEIAAGAALTRQRVWQIVRDKEVQARLTSPAEPTKISMSELIKVQEDTVQYLRDTPEQPSAAHYRLPDRPAHTRLPETDL